MILIILFIIFFDGAKLLLFFEMTKEKCGNLQMAKRLYISKV